MTAGRNNMDRHPALMDPRAPLHEPDSRPARTIPWTFIWLGVLTLAVVAAVAWVLLNPGKLTPLSVNSSGNGGAAARDDDTGKKERAVAIARVDVEHGI